jgi:uncharacterized protein (TIGR02147 family)
VDSIAKPNVYSYADYRRFLADHYAYAKAAEYGFSFRAFSARAGIRSSNYLKLVIDGERNLSPAMAVRFAKGCGLSGERAEFFCELVAYGQAETLSERNRGYERLYRFRPFRAVHQLAKEQADYHSQWYLPAIRELTRRADFSEDPSWIAAQLVPKISAAQAEKALATLLKLRLLERTPDGTGSRLQQQSALVTTGSGPLGHQIVSFHHMMLERAGHALDHSSRAERDISCLTLCVSSAKLEEIKRRVRALRQELLQAAELEDQPERVVQVNFQIFPLSVAVATEAPAPAPREPVRAARKRKRP